LDSTSGVRVGGFVRRSLSQVEGVLRFANGSSGMAENTGPAEGRIVGSVWCSSGSCILAEVSGSGCLSEAGKPAISLAGVLLGMVEDSGPSEVVDSARRSSAGTQVLLGGMEQTGDSWWATSRVGIADFSLEREELADGF
jgi:hypothetical protein